MEEKKDRQEINFVSSWISSRMAENPASDVIKAIDSALNGESLDESKLIKILEELVKRSNKGGHD